MAQSFKKVRYLGTWISKNGKFGMARKHLANQVKKAAFALIAIMKRLNHPLIPVMLKLYESMIKPIMCYGSEIWGFKEDKELEKIEFWFLPNSAVGMVVRGELGQ